jgi:hypothetical protein
MSSLTSTGNGNLIIIAQMRSNALNHTSKDRHRLGHFVHQGGIAKDEEASPQHLKTPMNAVARKVERDPQQMSSSLVKYLIIRPSRLQP